MFKTLYDRSLTWWQSNIITEIERHEAPKGAVKRNVSRFVSRHAEMHHSYPMLDSKYYLVNRDHMDTIISSDKTNWRMYESQTFDCENYALSFMADVQRSFGINSIGLVVDGAGGHAYNLWAIKDENSISIQLYEPQEDKLIKPDDEDKYEFNRVSVII